MKHKLRSAQSTEGRRMAGVRLPRRLTPGIVGGQWDET